MSQTRMRYPMQHAMMWWLPIVLMMVLFHGVARADPPARVGRVAWIEGAVSVAISAPDQQWSVAGVNYPVTGGYRFWSDTDSRAEFQLAGSVVRINERSALEVSRLEDDYVELFVSQGSLNINLRQLPRDDRFAINTPNASFLLDRGGYYRIDVADTGDRSSITVRAGHVRVALRDGDIDVWPGQTAWFDVNSGAAYNLQQAQAEDGFDAWSVARERQLREADTRRYVSPEVTGYQDLDNYGVWRDVPRYGAVWFPTAVASGWAPYRHGHWAWVSPWGWTWIDEAPWGFAPFHYGRWAYFEQGWAWVPGQIVVRPVYAPALVAFVGGDTPGFAPDHCGWFPLAPQEVYVPWYQASRTYVHNLNVTSVNVTTINQVVRVSGGNTTVISTVQYANLGAPGATTIVPQQVFAGGGPVARALAPGMVAAVVMANRQPILYRPPVGRPEYGHHPGLEPSPGRPPEMAMNRPGSPVGRGPVPPFGRPAAPGGPLLQGGTGNSAHPTDQPLPFGQVEAPVRGGISTRDPQYQTRIKIGPDGRIDPRGEQVPIGQPQPATRIRIGPDGRIDPRGDRGQPNPAPQPIAPQARTDQRPAEAPPPPRRMQVAPPEPPRQPPQLKRVPSPVTIDPPAGGPQQAQGQPQGQGQGQGQPQGPGQGRDRGDDRRRGRE